MNLDEIKKEIGRMRGLHLPVRITITDVADGFARQIDPTYVAGGKDNHQLTLEVRRRLVKELDERKP